MGFPVRRLRRLRSQESVRKLVRETDLAAADFVYPLFASAEPNGREELAGIPGGLRLSGDHLVAEARRVWEAGIPAALLFGIPAEADKDDKASMAYSDRGPIQQAIRSIKKALPDLTLIADVCMCEYMSHGHCGVLVEDRIDNDRTLKLIGQSARSLAEAGADVIAPSGMMDGMVGAIRAALDGAGHQQVLTMPYAAKFASNLYGPFKAGTNSRPEHGKHHTHQVDFANGDEALREVALDLQEGADIVIVKPALTYLDIVYRVRHEFNVPVAAYYVSGEAAMVAAAAEQGRIDRDAFILESLTSIKRAGADAIITYFALDAVRLLGAKD